MRGNVDAACDRLDQGSEIEMSPDTAVHKITPERRLIDSRNILQLLLLLLLLPLTLLLFLSAAAEESDEGAAASWRHYLPVICLCRLLDFRQNVFSKTDYLKIELDHFSLICDCS